MTSPSDHHHTHDGGHRHPRRLRGLLHLGGHSHSHDTADRVDPALQASAQGMAALKISFAGLAVTAAAQLAVLVLSGSVALLADTIHNVADALTAIPLGVAFWVGRRTPNRRYTYGYGRAEDLAGISVVAVISASAVLAGVEAIRRLLHPSTPGHLAWVAVAGVIGFVGNELVAHYRIRVGRRIGSAALEADGYHARTDGLSSLGVVAGAGGVALGWHTADPVFGLLITATILLAVRSSARSIYHRLMDAIDPGLVHVAEQVLAATPGIEAVDRLRMRWVGHDLHAEAAITCDAQRTLHAAHDIAEEGRHRLLHALPRLRSVTVHVNPTSAGGTDPHARTAHHHPHHQPA
jgi:cation diffusion facilitator family transporter